MDYKADGVRTRGR